MFHGQLQKLNVRRRFAAIRAPRPPARRGKTPRTIMKPIAVSAAVTTTARISQSPARLLRSSP